MCGYYSVSLWVVLPHSSVLIGSITVEGTSMLWESVKGREG